MTPEMVGGIARAILASVGGSLVAAGYVDQSTLQAGIGAVVTLITIGWSVWSKRAK